MNESRVVKTANHAPPSLQNLICLLFIFADQVFIDPTFFSIFVCGPLQSFVVNVDASRSYFGLDLDCKTVIFFSKSVKKSVKRGVRVV